MLLLLCREQGQYGRNACDEGDFVVLDIAQGDLGVKGAHDNDSRARVKRRGGAARVQTAAVKPRSHVHRDIRGVERKVHDNVVSREHLVDVVERHALGSACGTRGLQANDLVVDVRSKVYGRVDLGAALNVVLIENVSLGDCKFFFGIIYRDNDLGLVFAQLESPDCSIDDLSVVEVYPGLVVADDLGCFAGREVEVRGVADSADFLRRNICKEEFGRVEKLHENYVALLYAVLFEGVREAVSFGVELCVIPIALACGVDRCHAVAEAADVAHKAVEPGKLALKGFLKHRNVVCVSHGYLHSFRRRMGLFIPRIFRQ